MDVRVQNFPYIGIATGLGICGVCVSSSIINEGALVKKCFVQDRGPIHFKLTLVDKFGVSNSIPESLFRSQLVQS